jgi:large subunit ribosomal protein L1
MSIPREQIMNSLAKARDTAPKRSFEQSIDLTINLRDLDMRQPANRINLRLQLPNDVGGRKVLIFASGDLALRARRARVDEVVEPNELNELSKDKRIAKKKLKEYDIFIAEAPLMPTVGRVAGPILGPRGKMPIPVPPQAPIETILERERRTVILRSRDKLFVKCIIGRESMEDEAIAHNIEAVISNINNALKRGMNNVESIYVKLTMGPAIKIY